MSTPNQYHQMQAPPPPPPKPNKAHVALTYANGNGTYGGARASTGSASGGGGGDSNSRNGSISSLTDSYTNQNGNGRSPCNTPPRTDREQVVMTPKGKTSNSTVILIERKLVDEISDRVHVAGGDHTGIIINKDTVGGQKSANVPAQLSLEFRVFLVSANSGKHSQESRTLRFWFRQWLRNEEKQAQIAQDFFKELVSPKDFPRGKRLAVAFYFFNKLYISFVSKIMWVSLRRL